MLMLFNDETFNVKLKTFTTMIKSNVKAQLLRFIIR